MGFTRKRIALFVLVMIGLSVTMTNCSGFSAMSGLGISNGASGSSSLDIGATPQLDGKAIYAASCAACHGPVESSTKKGKSVADISGAIKTISQMTSLVSLSPEEIQAVALSLSTAKSEPGTVAEIGGVDFLPVGSPYTCDPSQRGLSNTGSRRLTKDEIVNSYVVLFGTDVQTDVMASLNALPIEAGSNRVENFSSSAFDTDTMLRTFLDLGMRTADSAFARAQVRASILKGCDTNAQAATVCADNLNAFGARIFRRPLTDDEKTSTKTIVAALGGENGLKAALARFIASPFFYNLIESDQSTIVGRRYKLTPYEVAARLAFQLTGATPDDTLMAAAASGQLATLAQLKTQATRLATGTLARKRFRDFIIAWLKLSPNSELSPQSAPILSLSSVTGLGPALSEELLSFADVSVFQQNAGFSSLLQSKLAFPSDPLVASFYKIPRSTTPVMLSGNDYKGLFLRPGFLSSGGLATHPIVRGVQFRRRILCSNLPSPDTAIIAIRSTAESGFSPVDYSGRDIVANATKDPTCTSCHSIINPLGFALESYGPFGEKRTIESVYDTNGKQIATHPINTVVTSPNIPGRALASINDASSLVDELAQSASAMRCMSQQIFRETRVRRANANDACLLEDLTSVLAGGGSVVDALVNNAANEDSFYRAIGN